MRTKILVSSQLYQFLEDSGSVAVYARGCLGSILGFESGIPLTMILRAAGSLCNTNCENEKRSCRRIRLKLVFNFIPVHNVQQCVHYTYILILYSVHCTKVHRKPKFCIWISEFVILAHVVLSVNLLATRNAMYPCQSARTCKTFWGLCCFKFNRFAI